MDDKLALLERLRIDRNRTSAHSGRSRRLRWMLGIAMAVILGATGLYMAAFDHSAVPVHIAVARALASRSGVSGEPSLLDASGYVVALRQATVSAKSIYKVAEVFVQEGQAVEQGEVIARLDDSNTLAALEQSKAQVKQLQAQLVAARLAAHDARPSFLRNQQQLAEGLISPETFDASKSTYDAAQTAALVAERNLGFAMATEEINQRYEDDTVIRSPFKGVVTAKNAQPGQIVSPQFSGGGGIVMVVDMDSLEVDVDVNESFINRVHPRQVATITLDAYPDWHIPAEVIAVIPTADRAKATVKVRIAFKQKDARIVPEMGARVSFLDAARGRPSGTPAATGVLVPAAAVQGDLESGTVFVVNRDSVERRTVRLGSRNADGQTILSDLSVGTVVAIGDFSKLSDGLRVRIMK